MKKVLKVKSVAVKNFMDDVYKELKKRKVPLCKFSTIILGGPAVLAQMKSCKHYTSVGKLEQLASGLNKRLVISLEDK